MFATLVVKGCCYVLRGAFGPCLGEKKEEGGFFFFVGKGQVSTTYIGRMGDNKIKEISSSHVATMAAPLRRFRLLKIRRCISWTIPSHSASMARIVLPAVFKFGRRVHFVLRRKLRKPPITRVPAILNGPTNRPSWKADSIYADIVKRWSTRPWMTSIRVHSKFEWRKWPLKSISTFIRMHFCLPSYSVPDSWHIFVK